MFDWFIRGLIVLVVPLVTYIQISRDATGILIGVLIALIVLGIELGIGKIPLDTLIIAVLGGIIGLILAKLLDYIIVLTENQRLYEFMKSYSLIIKLVLLYLGIVVAVKKKQELDLLDKNLLPPRGALRKGLDLVVLDTSVIIDGRIADVCETNFISSTIIIPKFILTELQHIADSEDSTLRDRGRRGLEILNRLQNTHEITVRIIDRDYPSLKEVDLKLVQLGKDLNAKVITTDFNLNKVAVLQGVTVLNVNDLANALKPIVLPGEAMSIYLVKEGKERNQGVGYLDDGTMVVVEDGRRLVGKKVEVTVTSIIQTSAGRMIFSKPVF